LPKRCSRCGAPAPFESAKGKTSVTDGPFAETKEHVGGFILIEAADMNQALEIAAAGIPLAKLGSIEVRPIMEITV